MSAIHTSIAGSLHSYTRSHTPWLFDENREAKGETSSGKKFGWRLFHYIAGGGMRTFGRSVQQEEADAKRNRFLLWSGVFAVIWFLLLVF